MFRRLWVGSRSPASNLMPLTCRRAQHQHRQFFTQRFPAQRTLRPRQGPRTHQKQSAVLTARLYGSVYLSIGLLVLDETLEWEVRQGIGIKTVQDITLEEDRETRWKRYWDTGSWLLEAYAGPEIEHHGSLHVGPETGFGAELQTRMMTAQDPENPGGTIILCQSAFMEDEEPEIYLSEHGNRLTDATEALTPTFEAFARQFPSVRGVLVLMQDNGDWKSVYFDGKRWINVVYLEWQTAESMGFY